MLSFKKSNSFKIAELREKDKSTSTLLVPAHLIDGLKLKKSEHGLKISAYLKNLLKLYKIFTPSGMIPPPRNSKMLVSILKEYPSDQITMTGSN